MRGVNQPKQPDEVTTRYEIWRAQNGESRLMDSWHERTLEAAQRNIDHLDRNLARRQQQQPEQFDGIRYYIVKVTETREVLP